MEGGGKEWKEGGERKRVERGWMEGRREGEVRTRIIERREGEVRMSGGREWVDEMEEEDGRREGGVGGE